MSSGILSKDSKLLPFSIVSVDSLSLGPQLIPSSPTTLDKRPYNVYELDMFSPPDSPIRNPFQEYNSSQQSSVQLPPLLKPNQKVPKLSKRQLDSINNLKSQGKPKVITPKEIYWDDSVTRPSTKYKFTRKPKPGNSLITSSFCEILDGTSQVLNGPHSFSKIEFSLIENSQEEAAIEMPIVSPNSASVSNNNRLGLSIEQFYERSIMKPIRGKQFSKNVTIPSDQMYPMTQLRSSSSLPVATQLQQNKSTAMMTTRKPPSPPPPVHHPHAHPHLHPHLHPHPHHTQPPVIVSSGRATPTMTIPTPVISIGEDEVSITSQDQLPSGALTQAGVAFDDDASAYESCVEVVGEEQDQHNPAMTMMMMENNNSILDLQSKLNLTAHSSLLEGGESSVLQMPVVASGHRIHALLSSPTPLTAAIVPPKPLFHPKVIGVTHQFRVESLPLQHHSHTITSEEETEQQSFVGGLGQEIVASYLSSNNDEEGGGLLLSQEASNLSPANQRLLLLSSGKEEEGEESQLLPYQAHQKILGWKLTSVQKRRDLLDLIDQVYDPISGKHSHHVKNHSHVKLTTKQVQQLQSLSLPNAEAYLASLLEEYAASCGGLLGMMEAGEHGRSSFTDRESIAWQQFVSRTVQARQSFSNVKSIHNLMQAQHNTFSQVKDNTTKQILAQSSSSSLKKRSFDRLTPLKKSISIASIGSSKPASAGIPDPQVIYNDPFYQQYQSQQLAYLANSSWIDDDDTNAVEQQQGEEVGLHSQRSSSFLLPAVGQEGGIIPQIVDIHIPVPDMHAPIPMQHWTSATATNAMSTSPTNHRNPITSSATATANTSQKKLYAMPMNIHKPRNRMVRFCNHFLLLSYHYLMVLFVVCE